MPPTTPISNTNLNQSSGVSEKIVYWNGKSIIFTAVIVLFVYYVLPFLSPLAFCDVSGEVCSLLEIIHPALFYVALAFFVYYLIPWPFKKVRMMWIICALISVLAYSGSIYFFRYDVVHKVKQEVEKNECGDLPHESLTNYCKSYFAIFEDKKLGSCTSISLIPEEFDAEFIRPAQSANGGDKVKTYIASGISGGWFRPPVLRKQEVEQYMGSYQKSESEVFEDWSKKAILSCMYVEHLKLLNRTTDCNSLDGYAKDVCLMMNFPDPFIDQSSFEESSREICDQVNDTKLKQICSERQEQKLYFDKNRSF